MSADQEVTREETSLGVVLFADEALGLVMRCNHCFDEHKLGLGDWGPGELVAKAAKHYCGGGWL